MSRHRLERRARQLLQHEQSERENARPALGAALGRERPLAKELARSQSAHRPLVGGGVAQHHSDEAALDEVHRVTDQSLLHDDLTAHVERRPELLGDHDEAGVLSAVKERARAQYRVVPTRVDVDAQRRRQLRQPRHRVALVRVVGGGAVHQPQVLIVLAHAALEGRGQALVVHGLVDRVHARGVRGAGGGEALDAQQHLRKDHSKEQRSHKQNGHGQHARRVVLGAERVTEHRGEGGVVPEDVEGPHAARRERVGVGGAGRLQQRRPRRGGVGQQQVEAIERIVRAQRRADVDPWESLEVGVAADGEEDVAVGVEGGPIERAAAEVAQHEHEEEVLDCLQRAVVLSRRDRAPPVALRPVMRPAEQVEPLPREECDVRVAAAREARVGVFGIGPAARQPELER